MQGSTQPKRWTISPDRPEAADLAHRLKVSPLVAQALLSRGLTETGDCQAFLSPNLKMLHEPAALPGVVIAAERIAAAVRDRRKIVIYGDYDVDGITAASILWHALKILGAQVDYYIPHRIDEGYGLNPQAVGQIIDQGAQLIVTVDCGVTAIESARVAAERGVELIITDHHQWHDGQLPQAAAIVHPRLSADGAPTYPNPNLCGAGVAFKLAWQIALCMGGAARVSGEFRDFLIEATALAALGTIADVVPLTGENRVLAHFGLCGLKSSKLIGIKALISSAGLTGQNLDSFHVGFLLAPRLNACGRMGHARKAVRMLTDAPADEAMQIAVYLEEQNRLRQNLEKQILADVLERIESDGFSPQRDRAIVVGADAWHAGVIGIVAARIVERYCRPTVLVAFDPDQGQGSARSIPGFHLANAFAACSGHLISHGGHEMAAGLKVKRENFESFRRDFGDYARQHVDDAMLTPEIKLEAEAGLGQMTEALVSDLHRLGPFGHGNRKPLFCFRDVQVAAPPRVVGRAGEHLQIMIRQGNARAKCIAFRQANLVNRLNPGTSIELAAEPTINEFNGYRSVELDVKDLRFT
ncbi:MAG TPA: single-stranded-DNA-specific exonuclease RecJ [Tepidisphaeraceae bacterium]|nr:single-stranded-DNA-specific exonuclease RecJ [Tepidisphaeraceae bacterium]